MENNKFTEELLIEKYIYKAKNEQHFTNEDLVGVFSSILLQLEMLHANEKVVLYKGLDTFKESINGRLIIDESQAIESKVDLNKINKILPEESSSFDIFSEQNLTTDISNQETEWLDKELVEEIPENILAPVFLPGYKSYENILGHHDPLTDIQVCGMIMASLAFSLDLREKEDLKTLQLIIRNPAYIGEKIHPNIIRVIIEMLHLDRRKRIRDAYSARLRLENYLEYSSSNQEDFDEVLEQYKPSEGDRNKWIMSKLRNRLFDLSRRNRLIYFKKSSRYVNLTLSSVPYVLDYKNIRPENLFIWNKDIETFIQTAGKIKLNKYLKTKDNPQIRSSLKKVYYEGNRDIAEFGFNQLKLAFCFLNWYNFKENSTEKIQSPLLLIPASLKKRKGINDNFTLELQQSEVQVNPVLSYYLKELYDIRLPHSYDIGIQNIDEIFEDVKSKINQKSNEVKLEIVKKPKLRLIHSLAKRSYETYQKKIRKAVTKTIWGGDGNYSYNQNDYRPLGLKLFKERIRKKASVLEFLINPNIKMTQEAIDSSVEQEFFKIESDGGINPYVWEFDLCNFTLGNFNYQKMTLVNDYDYLLEKEIDNKIINDLFTQNPKTILQQKIEVPGLENNYCVIPADPTQLKSIAKAEENKSYIIQGPPGTGKSQTIANLLASNVALGKSILFISEKRAALDVVYARMSQIGLKDICTLIHDSQADKKAFIFDLKDTYEKYSNEENYLEEVTIKRNEIISEIKNLLSVLNSFHNYQKDEEKGISVRNVLEVLISKGFKKEMMDPRVFENSPDYKIWLDKRDILYKIEKSIKNNTKFKSISTCPYLYMDERIYKTNNTDFVITNCNNLENDLSFIIKELKGITKRSFIKISELKMYVKAIESIMKLKDLNYLDLIDKNSELSNTYNKELRDINIIKSEISEINNKTKHWKRKPSIDELTRFIKQYKESKNGIFNLLIGKKAQFIKKLEEFYDFSQHMIDPDPEEIFRDLLKEFNLTREYKNKLKEYSVSSKIEEQDVFKARQQYDLLIEKSGKNNLLNDAFFKTVLKKGQTIIESYNNTISYKKILFEEEENINNIYDLIDELKINAPSLFSLSPRLKDWYDLPVQLRMFIRDHKLTLDEIEYVSAYKFLLKAANKSGSEITGSEISSLVENISELYPDLLAINSRYVKEMVKKKFQDALDLSYIPSYELTKAQTKKKKSYFEGRAVLENEFNKKIRYKAIRELASNESGVVVKDLKPIWMMSPVSVSDTLPLEEIFDIVIYDEASQITVEEGVPPLYRAHQAVIVGDEMQMPPSNYFSTKVDESDEEAEYLSIDAESLLNQGARKLPQVTLGWHYRSKQEALINFSNFAFYHGQLYTIPDVFKHKNDKQKIEVFDRKDAVLNLKKSLNNSITFHYLPNGIYQNRMNDSEAEYIAYMVREMLMGDNEKSIGIVAFSMQQQGNIERALNDLGVKDTKFAVALEEAYSGNKDEEFTGLFVKNLENVQGDERDIMILSICYGYNTRGKMLMNFGPINRRGGEKRLNVIFSRAKHHMIVVSSIKYNDITNEYNEGANYFKKYLQYSELVSKGESESAQAILNSLGRTKKSSNKANEKNVLAEKVKNTLEENGYFVDSELGQSRLKINLGVKKKKNQSKFNLGIIIDSENSYSSDDIFNEYYGTPNILQIFGWKVYKVFANDWLKNQSLVVKDIISTIEKTQEKEIDLIEEKVEVISEQETESLIKEMIHPEKNIFWNITLSGTKTTIEMGQIGEPGVVNSQFFDSKEEAKNFFEDQVSNRKVRGYQ